MNKCKQVGMLTGGKWDNCHDICRRVYLADAVSPTLVVQGGGQPRSENIRRTYY